MKLSILFLNRLFRKIRLLLLAIIMNKNIKAFFRKFILLRIIYREGYHLWREISVFLFANWLQKSHFPILSQEDLLANSQKYQLREFGKEETIELGKFVTTKIIPSRIPAKIAIKSEQVFKPFVCELDDVEIIGKSPVAFDRDRKLIIETTSPIFNPMPTHIAKNVPIKTILAAKTSPETTQPKIDIACLLINPWSNNFWHWTVDTITQLEGIEYYYKQTGIKPKLIVEANLRGWQRESLRLLGYENQDLILWQDYRRTVSKLIVPSFRRAYNQRQHGEISVSACQWLRKTVLQNLIQDPNLDESLSEKVYISRHKALGRRVSNETEVMAALQPLGFQLYVLEEMSYTDQVSLFAQAKVIIAPHGAGLTNLLFAEKPIILELFGAYVGNEFANLSRSLGFQYGCLACVSAKGEMRVKDGDMVVDVNEMLELLKVMES